jgi:hypothetical protein
VATHAPMLMAYPGARIYALPLTRAFLEAPGRFLRTLLADDQAGEGAARSRPAAGPPAPPPRGR